jgi:hypothetical protein
MQTFIYKLYNRNSMPRKAVLKNAKSRIVYAPLEDYKTLEALRINRSEFFRQAVAALRNGTFQYKQK